MAPMQFGFALQGRGPLSKPETLFKLAQKGDALRYDSVFVTDHVVIPVEIESAYPYSANGRFSGGLERAAISSRCRSWPTWPR